MAALSTVWASAAWTTVEMLATWWVRKALSPALGHVAAVAGGAGLVVVTVGPLAAGVGEWAAAAHV